MVKTCSAKCAKLIVFAVNIIFWVLGGILLGVGIWARVDKNFSSTWNALMQGKLAETTGRIDPSSAALLLIIVGAIIFAVGFCGCCGAMRESRLLLGIYIAFLVIVFVLELAAGITAAVYKGKVVDALKKSLKDDVKNLVRFNWTMGNDQQNIFTQFMFQTQFEAKCCGVDSYSEYYDGSQYQVDTKNVVQSAMGGDCRYLPATCCVQDANQKPTWQNPQMSLLTYGLCCFSPSATITPPGFSDNVNTRGCYSAVEQMVTTNLAWVAGIGIAFAAFQLVVMIAAICLCVSIGEDTYYN